MTKVCNKCNKEKNISEFYRHHITKDGYCNQCKICKRTINNKHYKKCKHKIIAKVTAYQKANPEFCKGWKRKSDLKRKYNLTPEQYNQMYLTQLGLCAICHEPFGEEMPKVDHCHNSKKVRGLTHNRCNVMLGCAKDNIEYLRLGIEYLQKYQ